MRRFATVLMVALMSVGAFASISQAQVVDDVTPSTNENNKDEGWAHFKVVDEGPGYVELEFVSTRTFASCFEYRTDGDTSEAIGATNPNEDVNDGLYPHACVNNSTETVTVTASEFVEVRMVFGAEGDERFDWTRVDVLGADACKNGGWAEYGFPNQGQCVQSVKSAK